MDGDFSLAAAVLVHHYYNCHTMEVTELGAQGLLSASPGPLQPPCSGTAAPLLAGHVLLGVQGLLAGQHCPLHYILVAVCPEGAVQVCNRTSHLLNHYHCYPLAEYELPLHHSSFLLSSVVWQL